MLADHGFESLLVNYIQLFPYKMLAEWTGAWHVLYDGSHHFSKTKKRFLLGSVTWFCSPSSFITLWCRNTSIYTMMFKHTQFDDLSKLNKINYQKGWIVKEIKTQQKTSIKFETLLKNMRIREILTEMSFSQLRTWCC